MIYGEDLIRLLQSLKTFLYILARRDVTLLLESDQYDTKNAERMSYVEVDAFLKLSTMYEE